MDAAQRQVLLAVARQGVEAAVTHQPSPSFASDDPVLCQHSGAFVTIRTQGRLRGCLGRFTADVPLVQTVREMGASAATSDPRFVNDRLRVDELTDCHIEVSVLSPLARTHDPLELELGTHGIYVKRGLATGCFLPQVATETGWSKEEFLNMCCSHKAFLEPGAWRSPDTEVYLFTAEVLEEDN